MMYSLVLSSLFLSLSFSRRPTERAAWCEERRILTRVLSLALSLFLSLSLSHTDLPKEPREVSNDIVERLLKLAHAGKLTAPEDVDKVERKRE